MLNLSQVTAQIRELVNKNTYAGNLELFKPTIGDNTKLRFLNCISVCPVGGEAPLHADTGSPTTWTVVYSPSHPAE